MTDINDFEAQAAQEEGEMNMGFTVSVLLSISIDNFLSERAYRWDSW